MKEQKRKRLEAAGWKFGSVREFLGLSDKEAEFIEIKLALAESVRRYRARARLSQAGLAARLHSSQSRVAKIEAADPSVSLDLVVRALLAAGARKGAFARAILRGPTKLVRRVETVRSASR